MGGSAYTLLFALTLSGWVVDEGSASQSVQAGAGAVFAASNAALMLAELEEAPSAAAREMQRVARRALNGW